MIEEFEEHDGGITDDALIDLVGTAFDEGHRGHETSDVLARGQQLLRRKRAVSGLGALAVVAASASLALTLAGSKTAAGANTAAGASPGHAPVSVISVVNVDTAAFSVHTNAKTGIVTVTVRQYDVEDEYLTQVLAEAGVRLIIDVSCTIDPRISSLNLFGVITTTLAKSVDGRPDVATYTIDPAKMPSGSVIEIGIIKGADAAHTTYSIRLDSSEPIGHCPTL